MRADEPDDLDEESPAEGAPPHPDSVRWLFHEAAVRNYIIAALAALSMVFLILFATTGPIGSVPIVLLGVAGLLFRWPGTPLLVLLFLLWFLIFPAGIPPAYENYYEISEGHFRPVDAILVFSVVAYVVCHYRVYGFTAQAMPFENTQRTKGEKAFRRPPTLTRGGEIGIFLAAAGVVVIGGQIVWLLATELEPDPGAFFPIKAAEERSFSRRGSSAPALSPGFNRFVLLAGMIFFTVVFVRLIFGYWRLRQLKSAEAGMILQHAGWHETRRENVRIESWLARRKNKLQDRARKPTK